MLPTKFRFIWPSSFKGEDFLEIDQSETRIACGVSVVCHLFTFHILIFSENSQLNELKLGRKHLWKVLSKECTFCYDPLPNVATTGNSVHMAKQFQRRRFFRNRPIRNKNCMWWLCLLTDRHEMNNFHRGPWIIVYPKSISIK
jgi:hypothetical protein